MAVYVPPCELVIKLFVCSLISSLGAYCRKTNPKNRQIQLPSINVVVYGRSVIDFKWHLCFRSASFHTAKFLWTRRLVELRLHGCLQGGPKK